MTLEVGGLRTGGGPYTGPDTDRQLRAPQSRARPSERQIYTGPDPSSELIAPRHLERLADERATSPADADLDSPPRHAPKFQPASQRWDADGYRERAPEDRPAPQRRGERGQDERGQADRGYRERAPEYRPAPQRRGERGQADRGYRERAPEYRPAPQRRGERGQDERGQADRGYRERAPEYRPAPQPHGERGYGERHYEERGSDLAGLRHLEQIAAEQANARGAARGTLKKFVTGPMAVLVTGPMAAVTAVFRPRDSGARRLPRITVFLPAHNEAASIAQTIRSLRRQTVPVASIIVVCDNCTDDTAAIAAAEGAEVMATVGNTARKAGALNQGFAAVLPRLRPDDLVLVMDADSHLSDNWIKEAARCMARDRSIAGACGTYAGEPGNGLIGQLQRNEFARAARLLAQRDRIWVLSGCGTLLRVSALREVARRRGVDLDGRPGEYYHSTSITEDFELTLALMTLGHRCKCVTSCVAYTELMPNWKNLVQQRLRWQKGTIRDLRNFGITRVTWRHWLRLLGGYLAYLIQVACLIVIADSLLAHQRYNLAWGIGVLAVTVINRLWTCRRAGWKGLAVALLTVPELGYNIFLAVVMFRALATELAQRDIAWNHVDGASR